MKLNILLSLLSLFLFFLPLQVQGQAQPETLEEDLAALEELLQDIVPDQEEDILGLGTDEFETEEFIFDEPGEFETDDIAFEEEDGLGEDEDAPKADAADEGRVPRPPEVVGTCIEGTCISGKGVMTFPDGGKYDGEFNQRRPWGKGMYTYPNGSIYKGDFFDGYRHG